MNLGFAMYLYNIYPVGVCRHGERQFPQVVHDLKLVMKLRSVLEVSQ